MFERIKLFHDNWLLHRDIKPDNFLIGNSSYKSLLFIIDYGLCKAYRHKTTGKHILFRKDKGVTGTVRYWSINTHLGYETSRKDDLESIIYYTYKLIIVWKIFKKNILIYWIKH